MFNEWHHWDDEDFRPEQVMFADTWAIYQAREAEARKLMPWASPGMEHIFRNCLLHTSTNVPGKIMYYATTDALIKNKPTRTSPQMFLERYLYKAPTYFKEVFEAEVCGKVLPEIKFIPNTDPGGWVRVYEEGPHSCMKHSGELVACYAHPKNNLALAYHEDANGQIINRSIVNQAKKLYVRIYGRGGDLFAVALHKAGYTKGPDKALYGEILDVIETNCANCGDYLIAGPYLDCGEQNVAKVEGGAIIESNGPHFLCHGVDDDGGHLCGSCWD